MTRWFMLLLTLGLTPGCGQTGPDLAKQTDVQAAFSAGEAALAKGDLPTAIAAYTKAIEGGLGGDQLVDAYANRAYCHIQSGNVAAGKNDLDKADEGGGGTLASLRAEAALALKDGNKAKAEKLFKEVRSLDPKAVVPADAP